MAQEKQYSQKQLQSLRTQYLESLPYRVERLRSSWSLSMNDPAALDATIQQAHSLASSSVIFDYPEISVLAREIDNLCQSISNKHGSDITTIQRMQQLLVELRNTLKQKVTNKSPQGNSSECVAEAIPITADSALVFIALNESTTSTEIATRICSEGYNICEFDNFNALYQEAASRQPAAIIIDMTFFDEASAASELTSQYTHKSHIPLLVLGTCDDMEARLTAIRAGACQYFTTPLKTERIVQTLDRLTAKPDDKQYRVLLINGNPEQAEFYRIQFNMAGMQVTSAYDAATTLSTLVTLDPDVIVVDINTDEINSAELGALIRQQDEYEHVPIVFLNIDGINQSYIKTMYPGVNLFLDSFESPTLLVQAIKLRAERTRHLKDGQANLHLALSHLEFLQNLIDTHAIMAMTDARGQITYVNQKFCDISGYSVNELLGQNHRLLKSGMHDDSFYQELWQTISSGRVWQGTLTNRAKDGHIYDVSTTIVPRLNDAGRPEQYVAIRTDITAIKELERKISEEADRLTLALEATCSGMWEWNIQSGTVIYGSSWRRLMQYTDDMHISWPLLIHDDDLNAVVDALIQHSEGRTQSYESEHRLINGAGECHWVRETGSIVERDENGWATRIIGTTQIIDSRVALEQQKHAMQNKLAHAAKMESIGHLTAGIAHDFNNLLGAVLGYTELSMELLNAPASDEAANIKDYLCQVISAGTRAKELIKQMLVFSRQQPETIGEETPLNLLKPILIEVLQLVRSTVPSSIDLNYHIEHDNLKLRIEAVHMHQILLNLIINARDAIGQFGQIEITQSQRHHQAVCCSCHKTFEGEYVEIAVCDTGGGIPPHQLQNIFDPFFSTKEVGKGTGMGLSVVHGLVHSLEGHITIESEEGQGTTVRVLLPCAIDESSLQATTENPQLDITETRLDGLRIMVVDDEIALSTMLAELFYHHDAEVFTYNKPEKALADFIRKPDFIDLLITDATMPGISGLELSRAMLQLRPQLPILICTGYSNYVNEDIALQSGIAAFMQKPLEIPRLLRWAKQQRNGKPIQ